jgi:hypothetical protein
MKWNAVQCDQRLAMSSALPSSSLSQDLQHDALFASFDMISSIFGEGIRTIPHISRYIYPHKWVYLYLIL